MKNIIKRICGKPLLANPVVSRPYIVIDKYPEIGDRVSFSDKILITYNEEPRRFLAKHVFEIVRKDCSAWQGVRLYLHCATYLDLNDVVVVPKDTPLFC